LTGAVLDEETAAPMETECRWGNPAITLRTHREQLLEVPQRGVDA
jgi:hypothetical protein